ncbi:MAG: DUF4395 domain-containing protein [Saprospiraceae bacterium]
MKKSIISFGEMNDEGTFKIVDERVWRASAGIMLFLGIIASINAFLLQRYIVVPYISGFLMVNFMIGVFINPRFSPTVVLGKIATYNQSSLPIGAIQKKFAWSLGLGLSTTIFFLSLILLNDPGFFEPVCFLCMICILLLYLETAFGICVGCKLYYLFINLGLIKRPEVAPNCMGDSCEI